MATFSTRLQSATKKTCTGKQWHSDTGREDCVTRSRAHTARPNTPTEVQHGRTLIQCAGPSCHCICALFTPCRSEGHGNTGIVNTGGYMEKGKERPDTTIGMKEMWIVNVRHAVQHVEAGRASGWLLPPPPSIFSPTTFTRHWLCLRKGCSLPWRRGRDIASYSCFLLVIFCLFWFHSLFLFYLFLIHPLVLLRISIYHKSKKKLWCALGVQNRLIGFPLFLMGKTESTYEDFGLWTAPRNRLSSYLEVLLYFHHYFLHMAYKLKNDIIKKWKVHLAYWSGEGRQTGRW